MLLVFFISLGWFLGEVSLFLASREMQSEGKKGFPCGCGRELVSLRDLTLAVVLFGCTECSARKLPPIRILVPVALGVVFGGGGVVFGLSFKLLAFAIICWLSAVVFLTDLTVMIIPDYVSLGFLVLGVSCWTGAQGLKGAYYSLQGALLWGGLFLLFFFASKRGMGGGDVKMAFGLGGLLGVKAGAVAVFLAATGGGAVGLALLLLGKGRKFRVPFGPFLASGILLAWLYGDSLLRLYWGFFRR